MTRFIALGIAVLMSLDAGAAFAEATVGAVSGTVLVNRGNGYVRLTGTSVKPGEQIMVRPGGQATLTYADGCVSRAVPGTVLVVGSASPCSMLTPIGSTDPSLADGQAETGVGGIGLPVVVGGLVVGTGIIAGVIGITSTNNDDNNKPLSP